MNPMQRGKDDPAVTILHVSDTQFGRYHRFNEHDSLAASLIRDVTKLRADGHIPPVDLMILSGDLAEQAAAEEFEQARHFVDQLCSALGLGLDHVVTVPGNHDVNWYSSEIAFLQWRKDHGRDATPPPPYAQKWDEYRKFATGLHGPAAFTEEQPYRLHRFDDLRVAVAALNSTIHESHRDEDHYGWCGEEQLRWFAGQLESSLANGMLRIGVVHHNVRRGATADDENLRDAGDLSAILGGHLDLLLHGHTHEGRRDSLPDGTPVLATGSAALEQDRRPDEVPNQYQVLSVRPGETTRWARQWDHIGKRWIADPRATRDGNGSAATVRLETPGWRPIEIEGDIQATHRMQSNVLRFEFRDFDFVRQVAEVTRADLSAPSNPNDVTVESKQKDGLEYVLGFRPGLRDRCVGVVDGSADKAIIQKLDNQVFAPLRARGAVELMVVHHGPDDPVLRDWARENGIHVKTWTEYNDLLDPSAYRVWLRKKLDDDSLYPQPLYQPQRFRSINRFGRAGNVQPDLLDEVHQTLLSENDQFALILGDAGFGKSFLVRRLAYRLLANERAGVTPIVIYLRERDKRQSLDEMVADALVPSGAAFQINRFNHSLQSGTLALLIDGYDEFAVRVGYDHAAAQLRTFTEALHGNAKILLTTRPSHFRNSDEATSKLFENLTSHQGRVYQLEPFDPGQQHGFLTQWFILKENEEDEASRLANDWMRALETVDNLPELARTPRMLSFIVEDLSLAEIKEAAQHGVVTAADLYQRLVSRWLSEEERKIGQGTPVPSDKRQEALEAIALGLWQGGERDVTEDTLRQSSRDVLDLPRLNLTADQAAQEIGGRTLLKIDGQRWRFAHQSVYEFLLASRLARALRNGPDDALMGTAELSELTIRFLRDLAPTEATAWVARISGSTGE